MRPPCYQIDARDNPESAFRWIRLPDEDKLARAGMILDLDSVDDYEISFLKDRISSLYESPITDVTVTHIVDPKLKELIYYPAKYVTIWFKNEIYTSIRNSYHKEIGDICKRVDPRISIFEHYLNFISFEYDLKNKLVCPDDAYDLVDDIYDISRLIEIYENVNDGAKPSEFKISWAKEYISKQRIIRLDDSLKYEELNQQLNPKDIFDLAILLHAFEIRNPNLRRMWSIDDVPKEFNDALDFFRYNHDRYY